MKIGETIKDNDPRMGERFLRIVDLSGPHHVIARRILHNGSLNSYPKKGFKIKLSRIHTDGKNRKGGFTLIEPKP